MQMWDEKDPCTYCGATSNTSHAKTCINAQLFDEDGKTIEAVAAINQYVTYGPPQDFQLSAKLFVARYYNNNHYDDLWITTEQVYVVWFAKTLQNWKCLLSTTIRDGMYYEVTHNGTKGETYLDAYRKVENVVYSDEAI